MKTPKEIWDETFYNLPNMIMTPDVMLSQLKEVTDKYLIQMTLGENAYVNREAYLVQDLSSKVNEILVPFSFCPGQLFVERTIGTKTDILFDGIDYLISYRETGETFVVLLFNPGEGSELRITRILKNKDFTSNQNMT